MNLRWQLSWTIKPVTLQTGSCVADTDSPAVTASSPSISAQTSRLRASALGVRLARGSLRGFLKPVEEKRRDGHPFDQFRGESRANTALRQEGLHEIGSPKRDTVAD